jgi:hypothetical protein
VCPLVKHGAADRDSVRWLLISALCVRLDAVVVKRALAQTRHHDLQIWEQANIPYTLRKKRQAFFAIFDNNKSQIPVKILRKLPV